jgi:hypothetical protein
MSSAKSSSAKSSSTKSSSTKSTKTSLKKSSSEIYYVFFYPDGKYEPAVLLYSTSKKPTIQNIMKKCKKEDFDELYDFQYEPDEKLHFQIISSDILNLKNADTKIKASDIIDDSSDSSDYSTDDE